jgi:hypothetical protein
MLNLLAFYREEEWRLILFPRRRHRPAAYDRPDPERLLISPGAVDMGGLVITPRETDFNRLDPETLRGIFEEVSTEQTFMEEIFARV